MDRGQPMFLGQPASQAVISGICCEIAWKKYQTTIGLDREVVVTRWLERAATALASLAGNLTGVSPAAPAPRRRPPVRRSAASADGRRRGTRDSEAAADTA